MPCQDVLVGSIEGSFDDTIATSLKETVGRVFLMSFVDVRSMSLLQHFIRHYEESGIERRNMLIVLNGVDEAAVAPARSLLVGAGVSLVVWLGPYSATALLYHQLRLIARVNAPDWLLYADVDEFVQLRQPAPKLIASLQRGGFTSLMGVLVDRVAADGHLNVVNATRSIAEQFPLRCHLTRYLLDAGNLKVALLRGDLRASSGHHGILNSEYFERNPSMASAALTSVAAADKPFVRRVVIFHYKWTAGIVEALKQRIELYKHLKAQWWQQSQRALDAITDNRLPIEEFCSTSRTQISSLSRSQLEHSTPT